MLVFDITKEESFYNVTNWLKAIDMVSTCDVFVTDITLKYYNVLLYIVATYFYNLLHLFSAL